VRPSCNLVGTGEFHILGTFSVEVSFFIVEKCRRGTIISGIRRGEEMGTTQVKAGSIAGPFILIAVGILFLLHNLTGFDVFHLIRQYWPLILIAVGVAKLIEHFRVSKQVSE
jgi:LiaI-LiaF-like transmembrane region